MSGERVEEAMKELQRLKDEIASLQKTQAAAAEDVKKARQAANQVQK